MPCHVGIILDGNRRHGRSLGITEPRELYDLGAKKLDDVLDWCAELGIPTVTLWVFSTDNFHRPPAEVSGILGSIEAKLTALACDPAIHRRRVRVRAIGSLAMLPEPVLAAISAAERATAGYDGLELNIAVAYGGRQEIADAVRGLLKCRVATQSTLAEVIEEITPEGVRAKGRNYAVDAIVFATGFDAMTGALLNIDIAGRDGRSLQEKWRGGPLTYLGVAMAGFPNLFTITGPGSPSVLTNMLPTIEQHVEWIADMLGYMAGRGLRLCEPTREAEDGWVAHADEVAGRTLRYTCSSWYLGVNIPGKPRAFMPYIGGFPRYVARCNEIAANGYEGFVLS